MVGADVAATACCLCSTWETVVVPAATVSGGRGTYLPGELPDAVAPSEVHTVFQIAGPETPGIMAEITQLLSHNGLEIRTAAVRTA